MMGIRPKTTKHTRTLTHAHTHTFKKHTYIQNPFTNTHYTRDCRLNMGEIRWSTFECMSKPIQKWRNMTNPAKMSLKTLQFKPQEQKGCKLFPTIFQIFFFFLFGFLNAAAPSVLNPNSPSVPET